MKAKIGALVATAAAAVATAGAAAWAKRKRDENESGPTATSAPSSAPDASAGATDAASESAETVNVDGDDLTRIKGIGSVSLGRLDGIGVTSFDQIAAWSDDDLESVAEQIKVSPERMRREDWVGQARVIVDG